MLVQLHAEIAVFTALRESSGKGFVGIEHLFHARIDIYVQDVGTQLVERQVDAGDTRYAVPVEAGFLPAAGGESYHSSGFPVRICMLPWAR